MARIQKTLMSLVALRKTGLAEACDEKTERIYGLIGDLLSWVSGEQDLDANAFSEAIKGGQSLCSEVLSMLHAEDAPTDALGFSLDLISEAAILALRLVRDWFSGAQAFMFLSDVCSIVRDIHADAERFSGVASEALRHATIPLFLEATLMSRACRAAEGPADAFPIDAFDPQETLAVLQRMSALLPLDYARLFAELRGCTHVLAYLATDASTRATVAGQAEQFLQRIGNKAYAQQYYDLAMAVTECVFHFVSGPPGACTYDALCAYMAALQDAARHVLRRFSAGALVQGLISHHLIEGTPFYLFVGCVQDALSKWLVVLFTLHLLGLCQQAQAPPLPPPPSPQAPALDELLCGVTGVVDYLLALYNLSSADYEALRRDITVLQLAKYKSDAAQHRALVLGAFVQGLHVLNAALRRVEALEPALTLLLAVDTRLHAAQTLARPRRAGRTPARAAAQADRNVDVTLSYLMSVVIRELFGARREDFDAAYARSSHLTHDYLLMLVSFDSVRAVAESREPLCVRSVTEDAGGPGSTAGASPGRGLAGQTAAWLLHPAASPRQAVRSIDRLHTVSDVFLAPAAARQYVSPEVNALPPAAAVAPETHNVAAYLVFLDRNLRRAGATEAFDPRLHADLGWVAVDAGYRSTAFCAYYVVHLSLRVLAELRAAPETAELCEHATRQTLLLRHVGYRMSVVAAGDTDYALCTETALLLARHVGELGPELADLLRALAGGGEPVYGELRLRHLGAFVYTLYQLLRRKHVLLRSLQPSERALLFGDEASFYVAYALARLGGALRAARTLGAVPSYLHVLYQLKDALTLLYAASLDVLVHFQCDFALAAAGADEGADEGAGPAPPADSLACMGRTYTAILLDMLVVADSPFALYRNAGTLVSAFLLDRYPGIHACARALSRGAPHLAGVVHNLPCVAVAYLAQRPREPAPPNVLQRYLDQVFSPQSLATFVQRAGAVVAGAADVPLLYDAEASEGLRARASEAGALLGALEGDAATTTAATMVLGSRTLYPVTGRVLSVLTDVFVLSPRVLRVAESSTFTRANMWLRHLAVHSPDTVLQIIVQAAARREHYGRVRSFVYAAVAASPLARENTALSNALVELCLARLEQLGVAVLTRDAYAEVTLYLQLFLLVAHTVSRPQYVEMYVLRTACTEDQFPRYTDYLRVVELRIRTLEALMRGCTGAVQKARLVQTFKALWSRLVCAMFERDHRAGTDTSVGAGALSAEERRMQGSVAASIFILPGLRRGAPAMHELCFVLRHTVAWLGSGSHVIGALLAELDNAFAATALTTGPGAGAAGDAFADTLLAHLGPGGVRTETDILVLPQPALTAFVVLVHLLYTVVFGGDLHASIGRVLDRVLAGLAGRGCSAVAFLLGLLELVPAHAALEARVAGYPVDSSFSSDAAGAGGADTASDARAAAAVAGSYYQDAGRDRPDSAHARLLHLCALLNVVHARLTDGVAAASQSFQRYIVSRNESYVLDQSAPAIFGAALEQRNVLAIMLLCGACARKTGLFTHDVDVSKLFEDLCAHHGLRVGAAAAGAALAPATVRCYQAYLQTLCEIAACNSDLHQSILARSGGDVVLVLLAVVNHHLRAHPRSRLPSRARAAGATADTGADADADADADAGTDMGVDVDVDMNPDADMLAPRRPGTAVVSAGFCEASVRALGCDARALNCDQAGYTYEYDIALQRRLGPYVALLCRDLKALGPGCAQPLLARLARAVDDAAAALLRDAPSILARRVCGGIRLPAFLALLDFLVQGLEEHCEGLVCVSCASLWALLLFFTTESRSADFHRRMDASEFAYPIVRRAIAVGMLSAPHVVSSAADGAAGGAASAASPIAALLAAEAPAPAALLVRSSRACFDHARSVIHGVHHAVLPMLYRLSTAPVVRAHPHACLLALSKLAAGALGRLRELLSVFVGDSTAAYVLENELPSVETRNLLVLLEPHLFLGLYVLAVVRHVRTTGLGSECAVLVDDAVHSVSRDLALYAADLRQLLQTFIRLAVGSGQAFPRLLDEPWFCCFLFSALDGGAGVIFEDAADGAASEAADGLAADLRAQVAAGIRYALRKGLARMARPCVTIFGSEPRPLAAILEDLERPRDAQQPRFVPCAAYEGVLRVFGSLLVLASEVSLQ